MTYPYGFGAMTGHTRGYNNHNYHNHHDPFHFRRNTGNFLSNMAYGLSAMNGNNYYGDSGYMPYGYSYGYPDYFGSYQPYSHNYRSWDNALYGNRYCNNNRFGGYSDTYRYWEGTKHEDIAPYGRMLDDEIAYERRLYNQDRGYQQGNSMQNMLRESAPNYNNNYNPYSNLNSDIVKMGDNYYKITNEDYFDDRDKYDYPPPRPNRNQQRCRPLARLFGGLFGTNDNCNCQHTRNLGCY